MTGQESKTQPIFLDDDLDLVGSMKEWQSDLGLQQYATADIDEALNWVESGVADVFICDLKMPAQDGIEVIQKARRLNHNIHIIILTGYELTEEQKNTVENLGGNICLKYKDLKDLLDSLVHGYTVGERSSKAIHLHTRVSKLEHLNRAWTSNLVRDLQEIKGLKDAWVSSVGDNFTVEQLIKDIQDCNERGIKHIKLWLGVQERLQSIGVRIRRRAK